MKAAYVIGFMLFAVFVQTEMEGGLKVFALISAFAAGFMAALPEKGQRN
jgi:hypothetical protein